MYILHFIKRGCTSANLVSDSFNILSIISKIFNMPSQHIYMNKAPCPSVCSCATLQTKCNWALKMSANVKPKTDTCYAFKMESARAILVFS